MPRLLKIVISLLSSLQEGAVDLPMSTVAQTLAITE